MVFPRAAYWLTGILILTIGCGGCRARPPVAAARIVAASESAHDQAAALAALAVCQRIYGSSAGLLSGFDATAAAGEFVVCTRNAPPAGDEGGDVEAMVLLQTHAREHHFVQVDSGYVGDSNCGDDAVTNKLADGHSEAWDMPNEASERDLGVERIKLGDTQALYVIRWTTMTEICRRTTWLEGYRATAWVQGQGSTVLIHECAAKVSNHDMLEKHCEIGTAMGPSGAVITVSESSINLRPTDLSHVVTTQHYHQRGEAFVLEKTETKTLEP